QLPCRFSVLCELSSAARRRLHAQSIERRAPTKFRSLRFFSFLRVPCLPSLRTLQTGWSGFEHPSAAPASPFPSPLVWEEDGARKKLLPVIFRVRFHTDLSNPWRILRSARLSAAARRSISLLQGNRPMSIRFRCVHCGHKLKILDDQAGKRCKCTRCGGTMTVPSVFPHQPPGPSPRPFVSPLSHLP